MIALHYNIGLNLKYLFAVSITTFLVSACIAFDKQAGFPPIHYESQTGLKYPESIIDLACLANSFPSQFKQNHNEQSTCFNQTLKNYIEIKEISDLVYDPVDESFISNSYPYLGIKGLHLKVFENKELDQNGHRYVFIVIRHQEHNSVLTDEMNEMMSLFGPAATVDREQGNKELFGTSVVSSFIRFTRQLFGLDYLPQAISMVNKIDLHFANRHNIKYIFSGFSAGGLYAIVLAFYFKQPAITFAATGVEDIVHSYYSHLFADVVERSSLPAVFNFAHHSDNVPQLDCQLGTICLFKPEDLDQQQILGKDDQEIIHLSTIYGKTGPDIIRWLYQRDKWSCTTSDNYNSLYGSCKRERLRWKDRMRLHSMKEQSADRDL